MRLLLLAFFTLPAMALEVTTTELPPAIVHEPYLPAPLGVRGGGFCPQNSVAYRVVAGLLPPGVSLSPGGFFSGIPRRTGTYAFVVKAANPCGFTTQALALEVRGAPILILQPAEGITFEMTQGGAAPAAGTAARVLASWPDLPYELRALNAPWLEVRPLRGRTPVDGSGFYGDPVTLAVDPSKLAPGTYRTTLKATTWEATNEPEIPVTLIVRP